jgi:hypothetical protein
MFSHDVRKNTGADPTRTDRLVRDLIRELIREGHPIGSCRKGYFFIETRAELEEVLEDLRGREAGLRLRRKKLEEAFQEF